jgi:hypothetical protein
MSERSTLEARRPSVPLARGYASVVIRATVSVRIHRPQRVANGRDGMGAGTTFAFMPHSALICGPVWCERRRSVHRSRSTFHGVGRPFHDRDFGRVAAPKTLLLRPKSRS